MGEGALVNKLVVWIEFGVEEDDEEELAAAGTTNDEEDDEEEDDDDEEDDGEPVELAVLPINEYLFVNCAADEEFDEATWICGVGGTWLWKLDPWPCPP